MIREFVSGDEALIAELESDCFSDPWSAEAVLSSKNEGIRFFLFEEGGKVVGYLGLQTVLDEGYITNVAVTKDFRRRGIARSLLENLDSLLTVGSLSFISLEVRESNAAAISLYTKMGYVAEGIRPNFYENPRENAIIMTKRR